MAYGQTVSDHVELTGDYDEWVFDGSSGDVVTIELTTTSSGRDLYLERDNPSGTTVARSGGHSNPPWEIVSQSP